MAEAEKTEELGGLGEGEATLLENDGLDNNEDLDLGDQMSDVERQARDQGWLPKNEFKGNPDDHKSAKHYVEWGDMKGIIKTIKNQMSHQKKSYEDQIVNQNILHKADTERQLAEVKAHLDADQYVTKLALEFDDSMSCMLHDDLSIKRIKFFDVIVEQNDDLDCTDLSCKIHADFTLMAGELNRMISNLHAEFDAKATDYLEG